jgi:hypothetical protein
VLKNLVLTLSFAKQNKSCTEQLREEVEKCPDLQGETVRETTYDELLEQDAEVVENHP